MLCIYMCCDGLSNQSNNWVNLLFNHYRNGKTDIIAKTSTRNDMDKTTDG